jgi:tyrosinase
MSGFWKRNDRGVTCSGRGLRHAGLALAAAAFFCSAPPATAACVAQMRPMAVERKLTLAAPLTVSLKLSPALARRHAACARQGMLHLTIVGARVTSGFSGGVLVFLNKGDATAQTPLSDPHYVGSFDFFPAGAATQDFTLDLSAGFVKVAGPGPIAITLVALPHPAGKAPAEISLKALRLQAGR